MIHYDRSLLVISQIDPCDRMILRQRPAKPGQPGVAVAVSPGQATTVTHGTSSLMRWDTKPDNRIRRTSSHPAPTRKKSY